MSLSRNNITYERETNNGRKEKVLQQIIQLLSPKKGLNMF